MAITVNGETITDQAIEEEFNRLKPDYEIYVAESSENASDEQLREWSAENLIERTVLRQEAIKLGEEISAEELNTLYEESKDAFEGIEKDEALQLIEHQIQIERLVEKLQEEAPEPSDKELRDYYEAHKESFTMPETIGARHIVKHIEQGEDKTEAYVEILNIREEISKGKSFEEMAEEHSDCPENAGDLGYFGRGQMVQEFEDVVFNLQPGEVSDVFLTNFGYHIAKIYDRRQPGHAPFEEVKDHIAHHIKEEHQNKTLEDYLDKLKADANIQR